MEFGNYPVFHVTLLKEGKIQGECTVTTAFTESEAVEKAKKLYGYVEEMDSKIIRL